MGVMGSEGCGTASPGTHLHTHPTSIPVCVCVRTHTHTHTHTIISTYVRTTHCTYEPCVYARTRACVRACACARMWPAGRLTPNLAQPSPTLVSPGHTPREAARPVAVQGRCAGMQAGCRPGQPQGGRGGQINSRVPGTARSRRVRGGAQSVVGRAAGQPSRGGS